MKREEKLQQIYRPVIESVADRDSRARFRSRELPQLGCKQGTVSKSQAGQTDLVGVGVGQNCATPGTQKAHTPALIFTDYRQFAQAESHQLDEPTPLPTWREIAFAVFMGLAFVGVTVAFAWSGAR